MSRPCPLTDEWAACYDGEHPIMEVGCAFGISTAAAARALEGRAGAGTRILATDMEQSHLAYVDALGIEGVRTAFCKLPSELPDAEVRAHGGLSAIMASEVFHFMTGAEIDRSLSWMHGALVPGGAVCITAVSPFCSGFFDDSQRAEALAMRERALAGGSRWPLDPGEGFAPVFPWQREEARDSSWDHIDGDAAELARTKSTALHHIGLELADACARAGLEVESARLAWREGYPESARLDGREAVMVVARKPSGR